MGPQLDEAGACTGACTGEPNSDPETDPTLAALVKVWGTLPDTARQQIADLLSNAAGNADAADDQTRQATA